MSQTKLRLNFAKQRADMAAAAQAVQKRQTDAAQQQEHWPEWADRLEQTVLPTLAKHTELVKSTRADVSLRPLERSKLRLVRFRQGLWRHPHLVGLRLRNVRLWFVAYRREIAQIILSVVVLSVTVLVFYLVVVNLETIVSFTWSLMKQIQKDLQL